jgi:hypothetical protein
VLGGTAMSLKNITPRRLRCAVGTCPAVYKELDGVHLRVIGQVIEAGELSANVGMDEGVFRIRKDYFQNVGGPLSRYLMKLGL